ncbi:MAG: histone deacetylase [Halobacteriales archaeon]|nr:histone deacetylase [Halobacteriales archaeon]
MKFGYDEACLDHDPGDRHPESPDRLRAIRRGLQRKHNVEYVSAEPASIDAITAVHDRAYVRSIEDFCADGGGSWDPDTIAVEATWTAARQSAGLAQWAATAAVEGADGRETPFSIGRPPGHHAVADDAMGFCFINNVAVAAESLLTDPDRDVDRVAIFDWDVHHGNGTQDIFYDRGDVFYASIHEAGLYPGTGELQELGEGDGQGTTLNVPFRAGAGDAAYLAALDDAIAPAIERFDPDVFLISAGFDVHRHDPISRMRVSTEGFGHLADRVRAIANATDAALAFVLEGGYSLDMLADGVAMVHEVFDGFDPGPVDETPDETVQDQIAAVRRAHGLGS